MKTLPNRLIAQKWKSGSPAKNHNNSFHTDGKNLYSYNLLIGRTTDANYKVLFNYTKECNSFISQTTSQHVRYAKSSADHFLHPEWVKNS